MMSVRDVQNGTIVDSGPVRMVGNILASLAGGDSSREDNVQSHVQAEPEPVIEEPLVEPIVVAENEQSTEPAIVFEDLAQNETQTEPAENIEVPVQ